jgi:solute carrier family 15 oligopeptide transporter 1
MILLQIGISKKIFSSEKYDHWLDAAKDKYDSGFVEDLKVLIRLLLLYITFPVFWALFEQQVNAF